MGRQELWPHCWWSWTLASEECISHPSSAARSPRGLSLVSTSIALWHFSVSLVMFLSMKTTFPLPERRRRVRRAGEGAVAPKRKKYQFASHRHPVSPELHLWSMGPPGITIAQAGLSPRSPRRACSAGEDPLPCPPGGGAFLGDHCYPVPAPLHSSS